MAEIDPHKAATGPHIYKSDPTTGQGKYIPVESTATEFPKMIYRKVKGALESKTVKSAEELEKLGKGWFGNPDCEQDPLNVKAEE